MKRAKLCHVAMHSQKVEVVAAVTLSGRGRRRWIAPSQEYFTMRVIPAKPGLNCALDKRARVVKLGKRSTKSARSGLSTRCTRFVALEMLA
jgi:hypothetical protein